MISVPCFYVFVDEEQIGLFSTEMNLGEIYARMIRCLYKKFTLLKGIKYSTDAFLKMIRSVGKLALDPLLSGNPLLQSQRFYKK